MIKLSRRQLRKLIIEVAMSENNSDMADQLKKHLDSTGNFGSDSGVTITRLKDGQAGKAPVLRSVTQVLGDPFLHVSIDAPKDLKTVAKEQLKKLGLSFYGALDKLVNNILSFEKESGAKFPWVATDKQNLYIFHAAKDGTLPVGAEYFDNFYSEY